VIVSGPDGKGLGRKDVNRLDQALAIARQTLARLPGDWSWIDDPAVDGDTVLEPDTVANLVQPFTDPAVGAVSGNAKVGNRSGLLGRWQHKIGRAHV
jgi:hypothetical protein